MHALVDLERPLARAGVTALAALQRLGRLVLAGMVSQSSFGGALEFTFGAAEGVGGAVFQLHVGF